jgi:hypothetical protein
MQHFQRRLMALVLGLLFLAVTGNAAASGLSGQVAQSYNAGSGVQSGMIVELQSPKSQTVVPLASNDIVDTLGVVVPANNADIVLAPTGTTQQQVLVATSGQATVLVSNQNGPIVSGNYIAISSLNGIGMAANTNQPNIVGRATSSFSGSSSTLGSVQLKNNQNHTTAVSLGSVAVNLSIGPNPMYSKSTTLVPGFANRLANSINGKPVSAQRIYLAGLLLIITAFISGSIMYGSTRGSVIALGRNPLSKQPIMQSLGLSLVMVLVIFAVGVFAVYLLLKL